MTINIAPTAVPPFVVICKRLFSKLMQVHSSELCQELRTLARDSSIGTLKQPHPAHRSARSVPPKDDVSFWEGGAGCAAVNQKYPARYQCLSHECFKPLVCDS